MNLLGVLHLLFMLARPADTTDVEIQPIALRLQVYPYGAYYSYPTTCPPGYYYRPGYRGWRSWGPGYYGRYRYGRCYPRWNLYYGPRYYRYHSL